MPPLGPPPAGCGCASRVRRAVPGRLSRPPRSPLSAPPSLPFPSCRCYRGPRGCSGPRALAPTGQGPQSYGLDGRARHSRGVLWSLVAARRRPGAASTWSGDLTATRALRIGRRADHCDKTRDAGGVHGGSSYESLKVAHRLVIQTLMTRMDGFTRFPLSLSTIQRSHSHGGEGGRERGRGREGDREGGREGERGRGGGGKRISSEGSA